MDVYSSSNGSYICDSNMGRCVLMIYIHLSLLQFVGFNIDLPHNYILLPHTLIKIAES